MKHRGQYTTPKLVKLQRQGHNVFPVFGRPVGMVNLRHSPRTKFDPKPWVWGSHEDGLRYSAWELTSEHQHAPEVTDGQWADQKHMIEDTNAFAHNMAHAAGVAA